MAPWLQMKFWLLGPHCIKCSAVITLKICLAKSLVSWDGMKKSVQLWVCVGIGYWVCAKAQNERRSISGMCSLPFWKTLSECVNKKCWLWLECSLCLFLLLARIAHELLPPSREENLARHLPLEVDWVLQDIFTTLLTKYICWNSCILIEAAHINNKAYCSSLFWQILWTFRVTTRVFLGTKPSLLKSQFLFSRGSRLQSIGIEITVGRCWIIHTVSGRGAGWGCWTDIPGALKWWRRLHS